VKFLASVGKIVHRKALNVCSIFQDVNVCFSIPLPQNTTSFEDISRLCSAHSELELFLWLTNTVSGQGLNLVEQQTAVALKERVISLINHGLGQSEALKLDHDYIARDKNIRAVWMKTKIRAVDDSMDRDFISVAETSFTPIINVPGEKVRAFMA